MNNAIKLSAHFALEEFTRSSTAQRYGFQNIPPLGAIQALRHLCTTILEPLRAHACQPIIITSGYRCPQLNAAVGGAKNSQHMTGEAVDIHINSLAEGREWFEWLKDHVPYDQLIMERASPTSMQYWIHVSLRKDGKNRGEVKYITKAK